MGLVTRVGFGSAARAPDVRSHGPEPRTDIWRSLRYDLREIGRDINDSRATRAKSCGRRLRGASPRHVHRVDDLEKVDLPDDMKGFLTELFPPLPLYLDVSDLVIEFRHSELHHTSWLF